MALFGGNKYSDDVLLQAVRKRLLGELSGKSGQSGHSQMQKVINNVYGSSGAPDTGSGGLVGNMGSGAGAPVPGGAGGGDDPYSYMVDIERENNPNGWTKRVKRYRTPKDQNSPIEDDEGVKKK